MNERNRHRPGDTYLVDVCTTTEGVLARDVTVAADRVVPLGCGCFRIETTRPGPTDGKLAGPMHLHVDRCAFHTANDHQPAAVRA